MWECVKNNIDVYKYIQIYYIAIGDDINAGK